MRSVVTGGILQAEERRSGELETLHQNIVECTSGQQLLGYVRAVDGRGMLLESANDTSSPSGPTLKAPNTVDLELVWQGG